MKKVILACCFIITVIQLAIGQEKENAVEDLSYIQHISNFRTICLQKNPEAVKRLSAFLENWKTGTFKKQLEEDVDKSRQHLINISLSIGVKLEDKLSYLSAISKSYQLKRKIGIEDIQTIQDNVELLEMIHAGLLDDDYPFKLNTKSDLLKELALYGIKPGDKIGEIGAGNGLFSLILSQAFPGVHLAINELNLETMEALKVKIDSRLDTYNPELMALTVGTNKSTNLEGSELDKIIIRNSYHHFDNKRAMLASIAKSLKNDGDLFIFERVSKFWKGNSYCKDAIRSKTIRKVIVRNGFRLVSEQKVGEAVLFHFVKSEKQKKPMTNCNRPSAGVLKPV